LLDAEYELKNLIIV